MTKGKIYLILGLAALCYMGIWAFKNLNLNPNHTVGEPIDSFNGVYVYYNGGVDNVLGRSLTSDGYNLGLKYQCVEFVKRYYYERLNHKMTDSYGHAKDFFDKSLKDGQKNQKRDLTQYQNPSQTKPQTDDLLVYDGNALNRYGHVAIVSKADGDEIEIIQQNPGAFAKSRETLKLKLENDKWHIDNKRILGWLRKE